MSRAWVEQNAHLVLEEAPQLEQRKSSSSSHLLLLSARTETALEQATQRLANFLQDHESVDLGDVAYTLQVGRKAFPHRRYTICNSRQDAISALNKNESKQVFSGLLDESAKRPLVLLFPGIGDHYVGMGHGLYEAWDVSARKLTDAHAFSRRT